MVDGFSSVDPRLARGPQVAAKPKRRRRSRGGGRSTLATPTPSAGELRGTTAEREAQIRAFRSGGQQALIQERKKTEERIRISNQKIRAVATASRAIRAAALRSKRISLARKIITSRTGIQQIQKLKIVQEAKARSTNFLDVISGGYLTERSIDKKQEKINQDIDNFNKRFGGKSLTESEDNQARRILKEISNREKGLIQERDKLASSAKSKAFKIVFGGGRITSKERADTIKKNKQKIETQERNLKELNRKIGVESKKGGVISRVNSNRLRNARSGTIEEIRRLKAGDPAKLFAGDLPIIPAVSIPSGVLKVAMVGEQRAIKGGKILTDIVFKTDKGGIGVAKGVEIVKGKTGSSIVLGRSGRKAFKFPSGKEKIINLQSFVGLEKTIASPTKLQLSTKVDVLKNSKRAGTLNVIKKNIEAMKQVGIGQVASVKGKKFLTPRISFPSGKISTKLSKGISIDDFASMSAILTKKDISLIVGKSITGIGTKSEFIGLIKGGVKARGSLALTANEKAQYAKALKKVVSATAAALAKAKKVPGTTKAVSLVSATNLVVSAAKPGTRLRTTTKPKTLIPKPGPINETVTRSKTKGASRTRTKTARKRRSATTTKTQVRVITKKKTKPATKTKSRTRTRTTRKTRSKTRTRQKTKVKTVKTKAKGRTIPKTGRAIRGLRGVRRIKGKQKRSKPTVKRRKQAYGVLARPIKRNKRSKRPRPVRVNIVPLKRKTAKDLRNYVVDTSLSRTARIRKVKGIPRKPKLKFPKGYASKTKGKFRTHRIIKGKRKPLQKGKVIERKRSLLDTRQEKRKISLRRRISQMTPKRKVTKKKPIRKRIIRKVSRKKPVRRRIIRRPKRKPIKRRRPIIRRRTKR